MLYRTVICVFLTAFLSLTILLAPVVAEAVTQKNASRQASLKSTKISEAKNIKAPSRKYSKYAKPRASSTSQNTRYSEFVVDAANGKVLHALNADASRYPASLTKMMTLYLTFDALKKGKLTLDERLPVSAKAARQPETNINLSAGDTISVRDAILSMIVRSANDSAMVLAEAIGRTEWNFGVMMTSKARALGMRNTIFKNPNGLPDAGQITTARDMAKLGIALRRDFPKYYPYFKVQQFSYNGRTYTGHNRVIGRFQGVDGIKTGYINASGFNLVTSVKRDGRTLVAVVMGGNSAQIRDNQMVALLGRTFAKLDRQEETQIAQAEKEEAEIPTPVEDPLIIKGDLTAVEETKVASIIAGEGAEGEVESSASHLDQAASHRLALTKQTVSVNEWGIQIGAYRQPSDAERAARNAQQLASAELATATMIISDRNRPEVKLHRARLASLSETQAKSACRRLIAAKSSCFVYRAADEL